MPISLALESVVPPRLLKMLLNGSDLVISMSGGKDSTATYLYLLDIGVIDLVERSGGRVLRVFADTGWELDETYAYLDTLAERFGKIDHVATWVPGPGEEKPEGYGLLVPLWKTERGGDGGVMHGDRWAYARIIETRLGRYSPMVRMMLEWRKIPSSVRRWCTDDTKKIPIVEYIAETADPVNCIGVRAEESRKRRAQPVVEWSDDYDAWVWRPIHQMKKQDVIDIHTRHGLEPNPLYIQGVGTGRVGCAPCVNSGGHDIRWLRKHHPERLEILAEIEQMIEALDPPRMQAGAGAPHWFWAPSARGGVEPVPVKEAIQRSSFDLGGDAPLLFEAQEAPGCVEWGLCSWG